MVFCYNKDLPLKVILTSDNLPARGTSLFAWRSSWFELGFRQQLGFSRG